MASQSTPISDDWEDVADDNLSVVSLPTSEDEADISVTKIDTKTDVSATSGSRIEHPTDPPDYIMSVADKLSAVSMSEWKETNVKSHNPSADDFRDAAEKYCVKYRVAEATAHRDDESHRGYGLDVDMDPTYLQKVSTSTVKLIGEIWNHVHFSSPYCDEEDDGDVHKQVGDVCKRLKQHHQALIPIMEGYSQHWNPERANINLPIDPSLYEWMSDLKIQLLGVQALLQNQMSCHASSTGSSTLLLDLAQYVRSLNESCDQMASFLPIMKTDYNDFHMANLPVASDPEISKVGVSEHAVAGRSFSNPGRLSGHAQLRREIYELKDQISTCTDGLKDFAERQPESAKRQFFQLKDSYDSIKSTLDILLSNHASEWIDHGLAGGITFPEFYRLNPDTVRSLNVQIREIADALKMERLRARHMKYGSDPDMMLGYEPEALEEAIETLQTIKEILEDLFQIKRKSNISHPEG